jgi:hypothetical protein
VVIRKVHIDIPVEQIKTKLIGDGFTVTAVKRMTNGKTGLETNSVKVTLQSLEQKNNLVKNGT